MFARGDLESINLIMRKVSEFSNATGLKMSIPKSKLYLGGVDVNTQGKIQQETCFEIGEMPFKYMGVHLDIKKLTVANNQPLL